QDHWDTVPWGDRIRLALGPASDTLATIEGPIDLAFIDADKAGYVAYWDAIVPLLRPGGIIVVDNVLWSGSVLDPQEASDHAIVRFNSHSQDDSRIEQVMLTVRDGILVGVRV
ncbi:MAG: class I SAM-dependent methyltransferase, partial [Myxococcota bacterium]|nr:class I SAM-dependent methyltransferase [Myxococcota bacterium]